MGKKIVCNDYGDLKQFREVTYQTTGDLDRFSDKILETIGDGDARETQGRRFIENRYDWDKIGERFYGALRQRLDL